MLDLIRVRSQLPKHRVAWFESIDSTMLETARLVRERGVKARMIVGAEQQTAGIGRQGHSWHSEAGAGLYVSIVLEARVGPEKLPLEAQIGPEKLPLVMLALGLGAHQAIAQISGLTPDLRWPNDVLLDGKKCAGILAHFESGAIIAGIGINVSHQHFPEDIAGLATSLLLAGAPQVSREELLVALVRGVEEHCEMLARDGGAAIRENFTRLSSYAQGLRVSVELDDRVAVGVTRGLDPSGFLMLHEDNGKDTTILAGGVRPL
jgi:BirA family transcriptional regulator, biotin operon repressor / biotin---[acetyl-CoA-carboxylase] ligase